MSKFKFQISKQFVIGILFVICNLLFGFTLLVSSASAGLIIRAPAYLGLQNGLVGSWNFDGPNISGTRAKDSSGNNFHGTLTNGPVQATGKIGQGLNFDGVDDHIAVSDVPSLNFGAADSFSVAFWAKPDTVVGTFVTKITSSLADGWRFYTSGSLLAFEVRETGGDDTQINVATTMTANVWTHVVGVVNRANNTMYLYFNGASVGTPADISGVGDLSTAGTNLFIGTYRAVSGDYIDGSLDDVRIYNRALSASEIQRLYNIGQASKVNRASTNTLTQGLVGCWTFDGAYTKAPDCSGNNNTGTLTNGPTKVAGKIGQGLKFDGVDDYADVANESNFDFDSTSSFSISAWVKYDPGTLAYYIVSKDQSTGNFPGYNLFIDTTNARLRVFIVGTTGGCGTDCIVVSTANDSITSSTWHYVAMTYNGSSQASGVHIYIDGVDMALTTNTDGLVSSPLNNTQVRIGHSPASGGFFKGSLDDVRVYNRALTASEIQRLYNIGQATKANVSSTNILTQGLVGCWTFDGAYTKAPDCSGNNNTGTLTNGPTKVAGKIGQALSFDDTNDGVNVPDAPFAMNTTDAYTISAWVYPTTNSGSGVVFSRGDISGGASNVVYNLFQNTTFWSAEISDGVTAQTLSSAANSLLLNTWQHLTLVWNGATNTLAMYRDGTPLADSSFTTVLWDGDHVNDRMTSIGYEETSSDFFFGGSIDDVRIYNRALSASEIQRLYNMGK